MMSGTTLSNGSSSHRREDSNAKAQSDVFISGNSDAHPEAEHNHHPKRKTSSVYRGDGNSPKTSCHQSNVRLFFGVCSFLCWIGRPNGYDIPEE
jgi:hypothetical protein